MNMNVDLEDKDTEDYIMSIAGMDEGDDTSEVNEGNKDVGGEEGTETATDGTPANKGEQTQQQKDGEQSSQKAEQQSDKSQQGKETSKQVPLRPLGDGSFADDKGNIVDEQGRVIAPAGVTARLHSQNRRLKSDLDAVIAEGQKYYEQSKVYSAMHEATQRAGISHDELATAIDMAGRMKTNPLSVAQEVVAMVSAQGYNVSDLLGSEVGDSIDMKAIKQLIDTRLGPITQQEQARQQGQQAEQRAVQAYESFVRQNAYADVHANDIAQVMKESGLSPQGAYNELMGIINRHQFDPTQPLGPQIEARKAQKQQTQQPNVQHQQKPMPNGATTQSDTIGGRSQQSAGAEASWEDIIRSAMTTQAN